MPLFDPANADSIPEPLTASPTWVLWQYQQRGESRAKVPIRRLPSGGFANADAHDPTSWVSFPQAVEIAGQHPDEIGIGFVLVEGSGIEGLDFDGCIDEAGVIHGEVAELLNLAGSYAEISPSGQGIRLIGYGKPLGTSDRKISKTRSGIGIERYTGKRFLTITGNGAAVPLADMAALREMLDACYFARKPAATRQASLGCDIAFDTAVCLHCLELLSPSRCDDYYHWLKVGTALAELGDEHAERFMQWSAKSAAFDGEECRRKWESLSRNATGDTGKAFGWMLAMAEEDCGLERGRILADVDAKLGRSRNDRKLVQLASRGRVVSQDADADIDELELPPPDGLAYRPFPIEALPSPVREFVLEVGRALFCDAGSLATFSLVTLSAAVGTTRRVQLKTTWRPFPILWAAVVANSGDLKTPSLEHATAPIRDRAARLRREHDVATEEYKRLKAEYDAAKKAGQALEPPVEPGAPPKLLAADATVEALGAALADNPRGIAIVLDELAALLGGMDKYKRGNSDEAFYLSAYGGLPHTIDRKTGEPKSIFVPRCALSIVGGIQPGKAQRALDAERRSSGFVQRLLFCWPPRRPYRWTDDEPRGLTLHNYTALVEKLYGLEEGDTGPEIIKLSPEARQAFKAWTVEHAKQSRGMSSDLAAAMSKLREIPARIGIVLHEIEIVTGRHPAGEPMAADTISRAIVIARWFRREAERVYALLEADSLAAAEIIQRDHATAAIVEELWEHGGRMSRREIAEAIGGKTPPATVVSALADLLARGAVIRHEEGTSDSWEAVPDKPLPPAAYSEFDAWAPPEAPQAEANDVEEGSLEI